MNFRSIKKVTSHGDTFFDLLLVPSNPELTSYVAVVAICFVCACSVLSWTSQKVPHKGALGGVSIEDSQFTNLTANLGSRRPPALSRGACPLPLLDQAARSFLYCNCFIPLGSFYYSTTLLPRFKSSLLFSPSHTLSFPAPFSFPFILHISPGT